MDILCYIDLLKINGGKNRITYYAKTIEEEISENLVVKIHKKTNSLFKTTKRNNEN